ncbi:MAG: LAGLIDADG family homing endonuclease [Candidatus Doudnabacteria bacterium]
MGDFVRGYFDGDGCVYVEKNAITKIPKRLRVIFTSGSSEFLRILSSKLKSTLDLNQSKIYDSRRSFQLSYSTKDSLKVLRYFYGSRPKLYLRRKKRVFTKALKKCDNWKVNDREMATWRSS